MDLNLDTTGAVPVAELLGDSLDLSCAEDIKNRLTFLASLHPKLVVDLSRLTYIDSAGCGALVTAQKRFQEAGGDLRVCHLSDPVKTVFNLARLTRVLHIYPTREAAISG